MEVATDKVTGACKPRHRHQEFLAFLKQVARAYLEGELHLVMDSYATHKRDQVRDWLAANPRIHVHFPPQAGGAPTPTCGSWLNLVKVWFDIIEGGAVHRGNFRCHPFVWTKTPDDILKKTWGRASSPPVQDAPA